MAKKLERVEAFDKKLSEWNISQDVRERARRLFTYTKADLLVYVHALCKNMVNSHPEREWLVSTQEKMVKGEKLSKEGPFADLAFTLTLLMALDKSWTTDAFGTLLLLYLAEGIDAHQLLEEVVKVVNTDEFDSHPDVLKDLDETDLNTQQ